MKIDTTRCDSWDDFFDAHHELAADELHDSFFDAVAQDVTSYDTDYSSWHVNYQEFIDLHIREHGEGGLSDKEMERYHELIDVFYADFVKDALLETFNRL